jgi:hypothetical protein
MVAVRADDSVNDALLPWPAPTLAGHGGGTDVAIESAGVVLASDDVRSVITLSAARYRTIGSWCMAGERRWWSPPPQRIAPCGCGDDIP